jgi:hypothetical protein
MSDRYQRGFDVLVSDYDMTQVSVDVCEDCGSLVYSRTQHDRWHDDLGRVGQQAQQASFMTNAIGGNIGRSRNPNDMEGEL